MDGSKWLLHEDQEVTATPEPPLVIGEHIPYSMKCPHGIVWYAEPTSEQRADWAERGVA